MSCPRAVVRIPRTRLRVVWGTGDTMDTFHPHSLFTRVDFPADGLPATATAPDFSPLPFYYLAKLDAMYYTDAASCEMCRRGDPIEKVWV